MPFIHCLLFGALISPTDPTAVLAILKETSAPRSLQADIAGESLLNDGVAVVVFLTILQLAGGGGEHGATESHSGVLPNVKLFAQEVLGGVVLGAVFGWIGIRLVRMAKGTSGRHSNFTGNGDGVLCALLEIVRFGSVGISGYRHLFWDFSAQVGSRRRRA